MLLIDNYDTLAEGAADLEEALFELRVAIKRLLKIFRVEFAGNKETGLSGIKLPKISVPTFDGKVLNWKSFWEHFDATIHSKTRLNITKKLIYLQDALKDSPARLVIQGLTWTSESYKEAIKCLKEYVCNIVDAVPTKNGSDKELHCLHNAAIQHHRVLKAANNNSFKQYSTYGHSPAETGQQDTVKMGGVQ